MSTDYKAVKMEQNESNQTNNAKKVSIASLMPKPFIEYIKEEPDDTETSINDEPESENQLLESEDMYQPPEYEHLYHPPGSEDINQPPESVQQPKIKNFPMPVRIKTERKSPSPTMEMIPFKKIKLEKQSKSQTETAESRIPTRREDEKEKASQRDLSKASPEPLDVNNCLNQNKSNPERIRTRGGRLQKLRDEVWKYAKLLEICLTEEEKVDYTILLSKAKKELNRIKRGKKD